MIYYNLLLPFVNLSKTGVNHKKASGSFIRGYRHRTYLPFVNIAKLLLIAIGLREGLSRGYMH